MIFAHLMGVPIEESVLALAPAGAAILTGAAVMARSKAAEIASGFGVTKRCQGASDADDHDQPDTFDRRPGADRAKDR
jgi:hypothetical protein